MSTTRKHSDERRKIKKMSKAQMQLAIIKKKRCDATALAIVEQLLEPNINPEWLLKNLGFINKSHMEDVIEERAIIKLCGYVLCSKPLTVIVRQQYHISTRTNKVFDVSRRKNFCSSSCYGAANYLLEQMLSSPLWSREKDDIPVFQILPINSESTRSIPGDEIDIVGINLSQKNVDTGSTNDDKESIEHSTAKQTNKDVLLNISSSKKENIDNSHLLNDTIAAKDVEAKEISINTNPQKLSNHKSHLSQLYTIQENKECDSEGYDSINYENDYENNDNIQKINVNSENLEIEIVGQSKNILHLHEHNNEDVENKNINVTCNNDNNKISQFSQSQSYEIDSNKNDGNKILPPQLNEKRNEQNNANERLQFQSDEISNKNDGNRKLQPQLGEINNSHDNVEEVMKPQLDKTCSDNIAFNKYNGCIKKNNTHKIKKNKKSKQKDNVKEQDIIYSKFTMHIERSIREWITENTLRLLTGDLDKRDQLIESLKNEERHQKICKKLCKLQLEDEKEDRANLEKNELKPLPHFSVLQEQGKQMELKVRAFYEGRMAITSPEDNKKELENNDDNNIVLPLTDSHTPKALRQRIFLRKFNYVLPAFMNAVGAQYNQDMFVLVKILVKTFNLSPSNIVFNVHQWKLVELIIIKMIGLIDAQLQSLLQSEQASKYTSRILALYKLDSNYLDRLIMEVTNKADASSSNDKQC